MLPIAEYSHVDQGFAGLESEFIGKEYPSPVGLLCPDWGSGRFSLMMAAGQWQMQELLRTWTRRCARRPEARMKPGTCIDSGHGQLRRDRWTLSERARSAVEDRRRTRFLPALWLHLQK